MADLQVIFAAQPPYLSAVIAADNKINALAERVIEKATVLDDRARRRLAIRAAVAAELVASALADYALAFDTSNRAPGGSDHIAGTLG